ncbi:MAG TPA: dihydrofolate reductase [Steroidobacteraceae bacterium]|nr:dihydrofolate reductase [Steroidobacteraceae bacterium]
MKAQISLVVAVADNGVIGRDGKLPWRLPDDMKHFRNLTLGKPLLMGRRTFESIGRPLSGRRNLVLSHTAMVPLAEVETVRSLEQALALIGEQELCVIGGAAVFALALPSASCIYLTRVHGRPEGDTRFPLSALREWQEIERSEHPADERHGYAMSFVRLQRTAATG